MSSLYINLGNHSVAQKKILMNLSFSYLMNVIFYENADDKFMYLYFQSRWVLKSKMVVHLQVIISYSEPPT